MTIVKSFRISADKKAYLRTPRLWTENMFSLTIRTNLGRIINIQVKTNTYCFTRKAKHIKAITVGRCNCQSVPINSKVSQYQGIVLDVLAIFSHILNSDMPLQVDLLME